MNFNQGWCHHCQKISYLKETGYKNENVAGNIIVTREFMGECEYCNRVLRKAIVEATEGNDENNS